tara:strand:+ start:39 stop:287 length:249 start_codon:yes stop_codon:yes gene_type:complete
MSKTAYVPKGVVLDDLEDFGEDIKWTAVADPKSYYPTRLEYFAGKALQGLCTGQSERQERSVVRRALLLAMEMEEALDSTKD